MMLENSRSETKATPRATKQGAKPASGAMKQSSTQARLFEVEIAGIPLRLKSSLTEEAVEELVQLVDRQIKAALPLTKTGSIQNAAILASLNLAEAFVTLRKMACSELEAVEHGALRIVSELESSNIKK